MLIKPPTHSNTAPPLGPPDNPGKSWATYFRQRPPHPKTLIAEKWRPILVNLKIYSFWTTFCCDYLAKRGHFWIPAGFPWFSWRSGNIAGDISPYKDDLVEALIARKNAQNWAPLPSLLHMSLIYPLFRRPSAAISSKKGPFWRPMGRAWFSWESGEIADNLSPSGGTPFQNLMAAKNSPFGRHFQPFPRDP